MRFYGKLQACLDSLKNNRRLAYSIQSTFVDELFLSLDEFLPLVGFPWLSTEVKLNWLYATQSHNMLPNLTNSSLFCLPPPHLFFAYMAKTSRLNILEDRSTKQLINENVRPTDIE